MLALVLTSSSSSPKISGSSVDASSRRACPASSGCSSLSKSGSKSSPAEKRAPPRLGRVSGSSHSSILRSNSSSLAAGSRPLSPSWTASLLTLSNAESGSGSGSDSGSGSGSDSGSGSGSVSGSGSSSGSGSELPSNSGSSSDSVSAAAPAPASFAIIPRSSSKLSSDSFSISSGANSIGSADSVAPLTTCASWTSGF